MGLLGFPVDYRKHKEHNYPKISNTRKIAVIILKFEQCNLSRIICPKDADGKANSVVDPDQTATSGALIWVYIMFTQTDLSQN